jgi:hypothetical protein
MNHPRGVPTIPEVLRKSVERFGRSGVGFGGVDPQVLFIPRAQVNDRLGDQRGGSEWDPIKILL